MAKSKTQIMPSPRVKMFASAPARPVSRKSTTRDVEIRSKSGSSLEMVLFLIRMG